MEATAGQFIETIVVAAGTLGAPGSAAGGDAAAVPQSPGFGARRDTPFFPQSVASGDPKPMSVILWTRVIDTKTAPEESDERPVCFAFASCQDFIERYYNGYLRFSLKMPARRSISSCTWGISSTKPRAIGGCHRAIPRGVCGSGMKRVRST